MCTTDRTPTALSIHKVKRNIFKFVASVFKSPLTPTAASITTLAGGKGKLGSDAPPPAARVGEDVCLRGAMARAESGVVHFDGWGWAGGVVLFFSSFRRTTSCQRYYGSTVDTTVFPLIHTLGQQARCRL